MIFAVVGKMGLLLQYGAVAASAFAVSLVGIVLLRRYWRFERGVDIGDGVRKHQEVPVLRVGGLPLYAAFVVAFFFALLKEQAESDILISFSFLLLGSAIFLLGLLDDLYGIPAQVKFLVQIAIAIGAYACGMRIDLITNPLEAESVDLGGYGLILTIIWFVAIPNLINLIDGMDGLAGGISLFLSLTLGVIGLMSGNSALAMLAFGMAGGMVAFLIFNLPPAKIYMGDGGAYLMGFLIAGASLLSHNKGSIFGPLLVVIIALGFPILDTSLAVLRRGLTGLPVMAPDARHLHHRLMTLGFSKRMIIMVLYGVFAGLCLLGLSVFSTKGDTLPIAGMVVVVVVLSCLRFLGLPHTVSEARAVIGDVIASRKDVRYAYSMAQVLEHDVDRIPSAAAYWGTVLTCLDKLGVVPVSGGVDGPSTLDGGRCRIVFPIGHDHVWALCCPAPTGRRSQWNRVIRCFLPALMNGRERWGEFPEGMGIGPRDHSELVHDVEERLNEFDEFDYAEAPANRKNLSKL
tara:strand:- start:123 stop:1673 length:1551 start_codon:yes stop_codon:yes gene_type:complete